MIVFFRIQTINFNTQGCLLGGFIDINIANKRPKDKTAGKKDHDPASGKVQANEPCNLVEKISHKANKAKVEDILEDLAPDKLDASEKGHKALKAPGLEGLVRH